MQCTLFIEGNYKKASGITFLVGGKEYFEALFRYVRSANQEIILQLYNLENDETGREMVEELKAAAERGVKVYLLLDAYGSRTMQGEPAEKLVGTGVRLRFFSPLIYRKLRTGRRLHHKVLVVDGIRALVGGINIANKYRGTEKEEPWIDFAIGLEGAVCMDIRLRCLRLSGIKSYVLLPVKAFQSSPGGSYSVRFIQNDWFRHKRNLYFNLKEAIRFAESELIIISGYFIPSFRLVRLLQQASRRGVKVYLYLQGKSDVPLARNATRFWYRALFRHRIHIFEFPERILHGKMLLADERWMSIGSYNFIHLSDYSSIESNVELLDSRAVKETKNRLMEVFSRDARRIEPAEYLVELGGFRKFKWWSSHILANFLQRIVFAFTSRNS